MMFFNLFLKELFVADICLALVLFCIILEYFVYVHALLAGHG